MKKNGRWPLLLLCVSILFLTACGAEQAPVPELSDAEYIFVHGLSGWGSYDKRYKRMPYWGMFGGDLMEYLRGQGFSCYAASVSPEGSAWWILAILLFLLAVGTLYLKLLDALQKRFSAKQRTRNPSQPN